GAAMALVNLAWRETPFVPPGDEPGLTTGRDFQENPQLQAVQEIARGRFPYPDRQHPDLKTYVNQPPHTFAVRVGGAVLFPDIVVMNSTTTEVEMIAEVESPRSLRHPDVIEKWQAFASAGPLYLYVPMSQLDKARSMLKPLKLRIGGLRAYKRNMG